MKIIVASPKAMCKFKKGEEEKHFFYILLIIFTEKIFLCYLNFIYFLIIY